MMPAFVAVGSSVEASLSPDADVIWCCLHHIGYRGRRTDAIQIDSGNSFLFDFVIWNIFFFGVFVFSNSILNICEVKNSPEYQTFSIDKIKREKTIANPWLLSWKSQLSISHRRQQTKQKLSISLAMRMGAVCVDVAFSLALSSHIVCRRRRLHQTGNFQNAFTISCILFVLWMFGIRYKFLWYFRIVSHCFWLYRLNWRVQYCQLFGF